MRRPSSHRSHASILALAFAGLIGCGSAHDTATGSWPLGQVGDSDTFPLTSDAPSWSKTVALAVGWLSTQCTVTHIGGGLAVTAGHCVNALKKEEHDRPCEGISIRWVQPESFALGSPIDCRRAVVMRQDGNLDYALLEFAKAPEQHVDLGEALPIGVAVALQSVSLPQGQPSYSEGCRGERDSDLPEKITHDCDTAPGSSGAALIAGGKMVGIHRGGKDGINLATSVDALVSAHRIKD